LLATLTCGNCVPQARHQRRGARPPRLCRPQAASFVKEAARVHRILPRVRHVRETPLLSGQDEHCLEVIWGWGQQKSFFKRDLTDRQITSVFQKVIRPSYARGSCAGKVHAFTSIASPYFRSKYIGKSGARGANNQSEPRGEHQDDTSPSGTAKSSGRPRFCPALRRLHCRAGVGGRQAARQS